MSHAPFIRNLLLAALPPDEYEHLSSYLEWQTLSPGQTLYSSDQPIDYAYFPLTAIVSLMNQLDGGQPTETTMVGNEGLVGVPLVLGTLQIPLTAVVQIPGETLRIRSDVFRTLLLQNKAFQAISLRYVQVLMAQIAQNLACIRLHPARERCCFQLALIQDRLGTSELPITQTTLARIVGIRRAGINEIVSALDRAQLIHHQRGRITVIDRSGLEAAACSCYHIVRDYFDRQAQ